MIKRFFDITFSALALVLLFPIFIFISFIIYLNLGRPIFFTQNRPGINSKIFTIVKFRTMKLSKSNDFNDVERMTKVGKYLRSFSLDELPELYNVLKGDMSLVGPRPLLVEYLSLYSKEQAIRQDVLPGLTGWAQINGRNNISWEKKLELDSWYVKNRSTYLDIKIIILTIWKVFSRKDISSDNHVTMEKFQGNKK